jgi:RNA 2',3'-cyclic 3'-phosphodiesterase
MNSDSDIARCFIAVYPDAGALEGIAEYIGCCRGFNNTIRWEHPAQVHITMKFIGDIERGKIRLIEADLRERLSGQCVLNARIDKTGAFPNFRNPSIVWVGFSEIQHGLQAIQRVIEDVCESAGTMRERKAFTPHFTIGRVKNYSKIGDLQNDLEACSLGSLPVVFDALRIMESTLTPAGAVHKELARIPFLRS